MPISNPIDPLRLEINLKNLNIIKLEFESLFKNENDKQYPFVSKPMLSAIMSCFVTEISLIQHDMAKCVDPLVRQTAAHRSQALKNCWGLLKFCFDTIAVIDSNAYHLYELILAGLAGDVPQPHLPQQYDDNHLVQQSIPKKRLALEVLGLYFDKHLPKHMPADALLPILQRFTNESFKFTALLIWILKQDLPPMNVIRSGVLHYFFSLHKQDASSMSIPFNSVYQLLDLVKNTHTAIQNLIFWTTHYACGDSDLPFTALSGEKRPLEFMPGNITAAREYALVFKQAVFVIPPGFALRLYSVFRLELLCLIIDQSSSTTHITEELALKECIHHMTKSEFLIFLEMMTQIDNWSLVTCIKRDCILKFQSFATTFDQQIEADINEKIYLNVDLIRRLTSQWKYLKQLTNSLKFIGYYFSWNLQELTQFKAMLFEYSFTACLHNNRSFDLICNAEIMMETETEGFDINDFLFQVLVRSKSEALQRMIITTLQIDPLIHDAQGQQDCLLITAVKKNLTLARLIMSISDNDKVDTLLKKRNKLGYSVVHGLVEDPTALTNLLFLLPLKRRADKVFQRDAAGSTVAHWAADNYTAVVKIWSLLPRADREYLFRMTNPSLETLLHLGATNTKLIEFYLTHVSITQFFKSDNKGNSVLHRAAVCPMILRMILNKLPLLNRFEELEKRNDTGQNVLLLSVSNKVSLMLLWDGYYKKKKKSFLIEMRDAYNNTLLHLAAPYTESFCFLVDALNLSAHPQYWMIRNKLDQTVLALAKDNPNLQHLIEQRPALNLLSNFTAFAPPSKKIYSKSVFFLPNERDDVLTLTEQRDSTLTNYSRSTVEPLAASFETREAKKSVPNNGLFFNVQFDESESTDMRAAKVLWANRN